MQMHCIAEGENGEGCVGRRITERGLVDGYGRMWGMDGSAR